MGMNTIEPKVKESYAKIARNLLELSNDSCCSTDASCCGGNEVKSAIEVSLGCDRRLIEIADPKQGEVVIDLGSGPGFDTRKIAPLVSPGQVYGIDFGEEMIDLARKNQGDMHNIEYLHAPITEVPLPDDTADLVISNCVFNLVPDKSKVFEEVYRVLRPGGRLVVSDMIANVSEKQVTGKDLCACIGGATSVEHYLEMMADAGLVELDYLPEYSSTYEGELESIPYQSVLFIGYKPE